MIPWRLALAYLFFLFTGFALSRTLGHYEPWFIMGFSLLLLGYTYWALGPEEFPKPWLWDRWLSTGLVFFAGRLLQKPALLYAEVSPFSTSLKILLISAVVLSTIIAGLIFYRGTFARPVAVVLLGTLLAARLIVPHLSSHPHIDVYTSNTLAADYLIMGENPYGQNYPDIYHGAYDYNPGLVYWPALLIWITPFRLLLGEIRYGFILAELIAVLAFIALGARRKAPESSTWLLGLLWFAFPPSLFIVEQSWVDPLLVATVSLLALAIHGKRRVIPGLLLGVSLAVKQYAVLVPVFLTAWMRKKKGTEWTLATFGIALLTLAGFLSFFLVEDAGAFYRSTVVVLAKQAMRPDSFSLYALWQHLWPTPWLGRLMTGLTLVWLAATAFLFVVRRGGTFLAWSAGSALAYTGIFLFGKQAFANYYYFSSFFVLLSLLAITPPVQNVPSSTTP